MRQVAEHLEMIQFPSRKCAAMRKDPSDLRAFSAQTQRRLVWGGTGLIIFIGTILIIVIFGVPAGACGVTFFLIALVPVGLVAVILAVLQWIVHKADKDS
jgi:hypothetical protein